MVQLGKKPGWSVDFSGFQDLIFFQTSHLNIFIWKLLGDVLYWCPFFQAGKITAEEKETLIRCPPDPNPPAMPENARMGGQWFVITGWNLSCREWYHISHQTRKRKIESTQKYLWEENMLVPLLFFCDCCQPRVVFFRIMFSYRWSII